MRDQVGRLLQEQEGAAAESATKPPILLPISIAVEPFPFATAQARFATVVFQVSSVTSRATIWPVGRR